MSERRIEQIKRLTSELTDKVKPLAKQAEAGFKANWMGLDKEGNAKWADIMPDIRPSKMVDKYLDKEKTVVPGIVYSTTGIPAMLDLIHEGAAPKWAVEADEKAGKIKKAVEKKIGAPEPKGLIEHLARASGEMVAQIPTSGRTIAQKAALKGPGLVEKAITQGPELYETVTEQGPKVIKKILTAPIEYFGPVVDVTTPGRAAMSYGVGTGFGGGLGYALDKLNESKEPSELKKMIDKYGPESGTEDHDISKPEGRQKFEKGGLGTRLKEGKSAFFSAIDNAIATLKQGKGTPEQLMSQVKKTPGVKKEELELRKIEKALAGKTSITKEELAEVAKKNAPPVPKIIRRKGKAVSSDDQIQYAISTGADENAMREVLDKFIEPVYKQWNGEKIITGFKFPSEHEDDFFAGKKVNMGSVKDYFKTLSKEGMITPEEVSPFTDAFRKLQRTVEEPRIATAKYNREGLRLEGGKDYQEILIQSPTTHDQFVQFQKDRGIDDYDEAAEQWRMETGLPVPDYHQGYTGGHWGADEPNILAHVRTQSFIDDEGKKVLHIEEVQSDPHQKGRDVRKRQVEREIERAEEDLARKLRLESESGLPPGWRIDADEPSADGYQQFVLRNAEGKVVSSINTLPDDVHYQTGAPMTYEDKVEKLKGMSTYEIYDGFLQQAKPLVDKKAIAANIDENFAYKTTEDEQKLVELKDSFERIREDGLETNEIASYFTPGKIVRGYGGYDKVLEFNPGDANTAWSVKVIEADPNTGEPLRGATPRTHMTDPSTEVLKDLRNQISTIESKIPDMPYKKTYDELAIKQIIEDAVQGGYDRVSLSPGITQVDRYTSQTRQVLDSLGWESTDKGLEVTGVKNGKMAFHATVENGKVVDASNTEFLGESLDNILGKDMADKIKAKPSGGSLEGDDITVGGEGMKSAYDKRMPDFMRDYLKKEYGTTLGTTSFGHGEQKGKKTYSELVEDLINGEDDLDVIHQDQLMEYYNDYLFTEGGKLARKEGLDPDNPEVQGMMFRSEGIFSDLSDEANEYAVTKLAGKLHDSQKSEWTNKLTAPAFDITPEMAEKVKTKGQRLFAASPVAILATTEDQDAKAEDLKNPAYRSEKGKAKIIADAMAAKQAELDKKNPEKKKEAPEQKPEEEKPGRDWLSQAPSRPKVGESKLKDIISFEGLAPYGLRNDGTSAKGKGYFGQLPSLEGFATEISSEDDQGEFPLLTPNLDYGQINQLLSNPSAQPSDEIYELAQKYANQRRSAGKSPFIESGELQYSLPDYAKGGRVKMFAGGSMGLVGIIPGKLLSQAQAQAQAAAQAQAQAEAAAKEEAAREIVYVANSNRNLRMPVNLDYNRYARDYKQPSYFSDISQHSDLKATPQAQRPKFLQSIIDSNYGDYGFSKGGKAMKRIKNRMK